MPVSYRLPYVGELLDLKCFIAVCILFPILAVSSRKKRNAFALLVSEHQEATNTNLNLYLAKSRVVSNQNRLYAIHLRMH